MTDEERDAAAVLELREALAHTLRAFARLPAGRRPLVCDRLGLISKLVAEAIVMLGDQVEDAADD